MVFCFAIALGQGCVLSVIPGRPPEGDIEGRGRLRANGPLVIGSLLQINVETIEGARGRILKPHSIFASENEHSGPLTGVLVGTA